MTGRPDANDVLRNYGEEAVRNGLAHARPYDPAEHKIEPEPQESNDQPVHIPFKPIDLWKLIDTSAAPERVWQVDGWLPGDDVCLLGGNGGDGKTQLALQLSYCTCIGHPWLGLKVRQGPVIYLTAEEPAGEINLRMRQIRKSILSSIQPKPFTLISRADAATSYLVTGQRGTVVPTLHLSELVALVDRARPALTVLDASADLFGGDEIKRAEVRSFIAALRSAIAIPYQCCVLLLTHPSVSGMTSGRDYSGTTAWNNSARSRLSLKRPSESADPDARSLELQKNNRGKTAEVQLRWVDGYFTTQSPSAAQDATKLAQAKQVFMSLVQRYDDQQRTASDKPGRNYAPALFEEEPEAEGLGSDLLRRAMIALFAGKKIKVVTEGYASAPRSRIVVVRDPE